MGILLRLRAALHCHRWRDVAVDLSRPSRVKQHCSGCRTKRWVIRERVAGGGYRETHVDWQTGDAPACQSNSDAPAVAPAGVSDPAAQSESCARGTTQTGTGD